MLINYTWTDFIKLALLLAVPYYAYVLIRYYRQDIMDWFSGRNKASSSAAGTKVVEEDEDEADLVDDVFTVSHYDNPKVSTTVERPVLQKEEVPAVSSVDLEESGPALAPKETESFLVPLGADIHRPNEQSVDSLVDTASRIAQREDGSVYAEDTEDQEATTLANIINAQQGKGAGRPAALADFKFNR